MTSLLILLLLQEGYETRLTIEAENKHNMGAILKRYLSDLPGILSMRFDSNTDSIILRMEIGAYLTKEEIEEELPRIYNVKRYEVVEMPGRVERVGPEVRFVMPELFRTFILRPTEYTAAWFEEIDRYLMKTNEWAVSGAVTEKRIGEGVHRELQMTIAVRALKNIKLPKTPIEDAKDRAIVVRALLDDVKDGERAAQAARSIDGVVDASYDSSGSILTLWLANDRKIDVARLRAAVKEHASAARIVLDGLIGTIHDGAGGPILRTASGMEFRIQGKTASTARTLADPRKRIYRVSGEVILVEDRVLVMARSLTVWRLP